MTAGAGASFRKLTDVLSVEEVVRLLDAAPRIKYRQAPGAALRRRAECVRGGALQGDDIDSKHMLLRIKEGEVCRNRNAMQPPQLMGHLSGLFELRDTAPAL